MPAEGGRRGMPRPASFNTGVVPGAPLRPELLAEDAPPTVQQGERIDTRPPIEQAKANWELYRTLTYELLKFIDKQDIDEFLAVERQRSDLVLRMQALPESEDYRKTPECQALIAEVVPLDKQIIYKAKSWLNKSRRQNTAVRAYDLTTPRFAAAGALLNKKF